MKSLALAASIAVTLMTVGTASAYHPADRTVRGTLEPEQSERIEFEDVQRGLFRAGSSATPAPRPGRSSHSSHLRDASRPPYLTEHHPR